ncbi:hypothetical protein DFQ30_011440, partial [Apophysomyces sp. BC1015]
RPPGTHTPDWQGDHGRWYCSAPATRSRIESYKFRYTEAPMRSTQQFSITLPNEMAELVKSKVAVGEYASESEVIRDGLRTLAARDKAIDAWLREQVVPAAKALAADPSRALTVDEQGMTYAVQFTPEAIDQLDAIEAFISDGGSPLTAASYVDSIIAFCEDIKTFPHRGTRRDDLFPGLRITNYRKSAVIAFIVNAHDETVSILGVFYGGQNYEAALSVNFEEWHSAR